MVLALTELPDSGEDEPLGHSCHCPPQIPFSTSNRISALYNSAWLPSQATFPHLPWACLLFSHYVQLFCSPVDCSPLGSSVHGLLQARILEWVTISFPRVSSQGSNSHLLHWQTDSFTTEPLGKPALGLGEAIWPCSFQGHVGEVMFASSRSRTSSSPPIPLVPLPDTLELDLVVTKFLVCS